MRRARPLGFWTSWQSWTRPTGVVAATHQVDEATARQIIADAARQAGQDELDVARELIRPSIGLRAAVTGRAKASPHWCPTPQCAHTEHRADSRLAGQPQEKPR